MKPKTRDAAFGKWRSILGHLGYGRLLGTKHQDCPICEAKKKFRFTDYKSNGEWICVCGQGDGFDLLMQVEGSSFEVVAKQVDEVIGNNDLKETFQPQVDYEKRRKNLNALWAGAQDDNLVIDYLNSRGLKFPRCFRLNDLRGHPYMYNADTGKRQVGMCALIRNSRGEPVSIHRTFCDPKAKKIMPPTQSIAGSGVQLGWNKKSKCLVVGEGIETTLAGMQHAMVPGLAAISAHGMETLLIPKQFATIIILADNDRSFTGQKAAFTLARRMDAEHRRVQVVMPMDQGDMLDVVTAVGPTIIEWDNDG
jgi:putative DNA primase/helicase